MSTCAVCGGSFADPASAWGGQACGDCIAAHIEATLGSFGGTRLDRKPMKRAMDRLAADGDRADVSCPETPRRAQGAG